ncbi:penicillin-binding protein 2 [Viscerimonas tarda]
MIKDRLAFEKRKFVIGGIAVGIVLILLIQLFNLQILKNEYKDSANSNAFYKKILYPARGTISDRNDKLLVYNQPTYDVVYIPREVEPFDTLDFCNILGITKEQMQKRIRDIKNKKLNPGYSPYTLQTFMTQLTMQEYGLLQENLYKFRGFDIQNKALRQYSYKNAAHVLGYVAEVNKSQIEADDYYMRGDYAGKSGVENSYENLLRGEKGVEILLRDAHGRIQGKYEEGVHDKSPTSGKNLKLAIDVDLQAYGEYLMRNKIGSIVMIEPETGEILCLVTSPTYDPAVLLGRDFGVNYKVLEKDASKPLFNRAIQGMYPPGSTFKPTQALIFLQENVITPETAYSCANGYPPGGGRPKCHSHFSPIPLEAAIATSCNSYFCYGLNAMLSNRSKKYKDISDAFDKWKNYMVAMGYGYKLGVDLPSEKRGFIPNSQYYTNAFGRSWSAPNIISIAIGQGEITATPIQIANLGATIANRGYFHVPHIVKEVQDTPLDTSFTNRKYTGIKTEYYESVVRGMANAVTGGTCRGTNLMPDFEVCGKTGTAQNPHGRDHSIFMGFAPKDHPKVAISVMVENGGFGATYAVPIGRLMFQKYLKGEVPASDAYIEERIANAVILPNMFVPVLKKIAAPEPEVVAADSQQEVL